MSEIYEQALINYVWFIEFERVKGGAKLLRYFRHRFNSPDRPKSDGAGQVIESDDGKRTVVAVEFIPYGVPSNKKRERLPVVNPRHVFTYDGREN